MGSPGTNDEPSTFSYNPDAASDGWREAYHTLLTHDEKLLNGYYEEIDSSLIFAGLFSAVLTAFVIETYQNLQSNPALDTNRLLTRISAQLEGTNISAKPLDPPHFVAAAPDLRINVFWFLSLLLSLASALFGIFFKQWLRLYMSWAEIIPEKAAIAVRQYRHEMMKRWRVHELIRVMPLLLQSALVLFAAGLLDFAIHLNPVLGSVLCGVTGVMILFIIGATLMPFLVTTSTPFRSPWSAPLAWLRLRVMVWIYLPRDAASVWAKNLTARGHQAISGYPTWNQLDQIVMANPQFPLAPDTNSWSPWSTRSLCSLVLGNRKRQILRTMAPCLFARLSMRRLHCLDIRDCCEIANYLVYTQSIDNVTAEGGDEDDDDTNSAVGVMGTSMKKELFHLLVQALRDWNALPDEEHDALATYADHALGILGRFRKAIDTDHLYLKLIVHLGTTGTEHSTRSPNAPTQSGRLDTLLKEVCIDPSPTFSDQQSQKLLLECWSLSDVIWISRRVTALLSSSNSTTLSLDLAILSLSSLLLAVHQYSNLSTRSHISNHLEALNIALYQRTPSPNELDGVSPIFWQAMYVLSSCHMALFPETLLQQLCELGAPNARVPSGPPTRRVAFLMLADVQKVFPELCRRLGTTSSSWMCPGFEPIETSSPWTNLDTYRPERTASSPFP